jgi:hypothetical protein
MVLAFEIILSDHYIKTKRNVVLKFRIYILRLFVFTVIPYHYSLLIVP